MSQGHGGAGQKAPAQGRRFLKHLVSVQGHPSPPQFLTLKIYFLGGMAGLGAGLCICLEDLLGKDWDRVDYKTLT